MDSRQRSASPSEHVAHIAHTYRKWDVPQHNQNTPALAAACDAAVPSGAAPAHTAGGAALPATAATPNPAVPNPAAAAAASTCTIEVRQAAPHCQAS